MKRGKDDEKVMGPMFPRLHVNDTEKGGPRAPPRNKMALYEQLSIPSQRFKPTLVPINSNNTANAIPPSSSQGSAQQSGMFYSHQLPPSRQAAEKTGCRNFDSSTPLMQLEQKKRLEEDDFMVPIFMQPNMGQDCGRSHNNVDREKAYPCSRASSPCSLKHRTTSDDIPGQMPRVGPTIRQEARSQHNDENLKECVPSREHSIKAVSNSSSRNNNEVALRQNNTSVCCEPGDNPVNNCGILQKSDHSLLPEHRAPCDPTSRTIGDAILDVSSRGKNNGNSSIAVWDYHSEEQTTLDDTESREDRTCRSLLAGNAERDDDTSETSMVDSISGMDITPDDVVGIIGQKHFWKARRAIVNQQRVFAVQVFELHRLIKVQKLIAGSPHLLLEDNSFLAKPIKVSSSKKLPLDYIVKGPPNAAKAKNDSDKPNHKMECSAENTVGKAASLSSVQNGSQLPSYRPLSANSPVTSLTGDPNLGPWCFHELQGHHQWLIPVMSPSEGLVYKPYPGPGYMASACGGCGPLGSMPMMGSFFNPAFGVPASHHYQGMGVPPFPAPNGPHGYFPPYGMPVLNQAAITGSAVDQMNHFSASGFHGKSSGVGANSNIQLQNSSTPSPEHGANGAIPDVTKPHVSRDSEVLVSTARSPIERVQGIGRGNSLEGNNVLSLFPTSPVIDASNTGTQPLDVDVPARVIRVVPHNGRSATESAARIFQSIQEERKQHDSV